MAYVDLLSLRLILNTYINASAALPQKRDIIVPPPRALPRAGADTITFLCLPNVISICILLPSADRSRFCFPSVPYYFI